MKEIAIIVLAACVVGCQRSASISPPAKNEALPQLLSRSHSVLVGEFGEPTFVTNAGCVWKAYPFQAVSIITGVHEVAALTRALAATGSEGNAGLCLCGALPEQVFADPDGRPIFSALVHVPANHVIISTNLVKLGDTIFSIWPTGEVRHGYDIATGNNARYGALALDIVERLWPEELNRREIKNHNQEPGDTAHKVAAPQH